jgi:hypothetical protein
MLPATPETLNRHNPTEERKNLPPRKKRYFTFEHVREALQTVRSHDRRREGLGLRDDFAPVAQQPNLPATPETPNQPNRPEAKRSTPPRKEQYAGSFLG